MVKAGVDKLPWRELMKRLKCDVVDASLHLLKFLPTCLSFGVFTVERKEEWMDY